ncbi:MAG: VWA domain-containing protein, partial [Chloroflexi bacterium]|nr:VWA domain-containing protein [Chloroflexota bacterium]
MLSYRYSQWDGTQQVFGPDQEQLMDELADDLLAHGDVWRALREMFQRGVQGQQGQRVEGLRELLERLRAMRQQQLERYNMDSLLEDLKQRLEQVKETERKGIDRRVEEARQRAGEQGGDPATDPLLKMLEGRAQKSKESLDNLPESLGGAIKELSSYEFMDPEAQRQFQELLEMLKGRMLQNHLKDLRQALQGMNPQQMAALREMLRSLNKMLQEKLRGGQPDFEGFMQQFGQFFGPNPPRSLEELLDRLQRQIAQAQSLLESMSPQQRQELEQLLESVLDPETMRELQELAAGLDELSPLEELRKQYQFLGDEPVTLDQAMELMGQLQSMDELEQKIQEVTRRGNLEDLDLDKVEEVLGRDARRHLEQLQRIAKMLEEAGYVQRKGRKLELTAKGIRKIAQKALKEVFARLRKDRVGGHDVIKRGSGGDFSGETKPFEFGDPLDLDLEKTVVNALLRNGPGTPVRIGPKDFEIRQTEHLTQAATVLLLDQSRSMGLFGSFQAAKKVALALHGLIHSQYPRDTLYIIGFSDYATEIKEEELPKVNWNAWVSGTNMQHALMLSRKLLSRHKGATRQVIMITDGEPTAHLEGDRALFSYPPSYQTIQETLKEVKRCTHEAITINTFMLESSSYLLDFVDKMTRINRGRAFYTTADHLGQYVLVDYVS